MRNLLGDEDVDRICTGGKQDEKEEENAGNRDFKAACNPSSREGAHNVPTRLSIEERATFSSFMLSSNQGRHGFDQDLHDHTMIASV